MILKKDHCCNFKLYYLLIFSFIYFGYNTLIQSSIIGTYMSFAITLFISFFLYFYTVIIKKNNLRINIKYIFLIITLLVLIILSMIINLDTSNGNFALMIKILQGAILAFCIPIRIFKRAFSTIMTFLGSWSLISLFILSNTLIKKLVPSIHNPLGLKFLNYGFSFVLDFPGHFGLRNYGIFTEPGIYVCFLLPALIFEMFDDNQKPRFWVTSILILTILSTFSPVGLIAVVILVVLYITRQGNINLKRKYVYFLIVIVVMILLFNNETYNSVASLSIDKLTNENLVGNSRFTSILLNIEEWIKSPIFGRGLTQVTYISDVLGSNTSTTTVFLVAYGAIFTIIMTISIYGIFKITDRKHISIILFLIYLIAINAQALLHSDFYWWITMAGALKLTANHNVETAV